MAIGISPQFFAVQRILWTGRLRQSRALCYEALKLSYENRGCTGVIGAPTYPMLKDLTLTAFRELLEENNVPHSFRRSENILSLLEPKSQILFRSLVSFERIRGTNLAWFGIDELTYCKEEAWLRLEARLRDPKAKHRCGFASWTPKGYGWVYDSLYRSRSETKLRSFSSLAKHRAPGRLLCKPAN
jgi:hypothetical protein